ncbi:MAG: hypothetical protein ACE5R3_06260, partial [Nitrosopumilaceae archaeon]
YVTNIGPEPTFGTVSLIVNGKTISSSAEIFEPGQTPIPLEWRIPKVGKQMAYNVQASVNLYDRQITTEIAEVNSFMKTQVIPLSQMSTAETITDRVGNVVAEPALLYASDYYHDHLRFRVIDHNGHCIIGGSEECEVRDSTATERGGIVSIEHEGIIYRVQYSGPYSPLERFSITSIDQFPEEWTITLESMDEFVPQAFALQDIDLKVKYRTISEIITVKST